MRRITLMFVALLPTLATGAQNDSIQLDEVRVEARPLLPNVTAVSPVQQLDRQTLLLSGALNLADVVRLFSGTDVRDYGGIGGMKTVSVRSLGAHHTAVSYDGVAVSNTQAGQIDIGRFALDNVAHVSLALGQYADLLQSARHYASAGVLSIVTERPRFEHKNWRVQARLQGGSFGAVAPSLRYWQKLGRQTFLSLDSRYMRADGVYPFTLVNGKNKTKEWRNNSQIYSVQQELNLNHVFQDSSTWDTKAYYYYSKRGLPGAVILYNNQSDETLWDENFFAQSVYARCLGRQLQLKLRTKYSYSRNKYEDIDVKYTGGRQTDNDYQNEYYASAALGWTLRPGLSVAFAEDVAVNTLRSNISNAYGEVADPVRFTSLSALTARYQDRRLTVEGHLLGTWSTERVHLSNKPDDRKRLSPSIAVSYRLLKDRSLFLRAMLKHTFRLPSFNDLYYIRLGNTMLRPEMAVEYNVGLTYALHRPAFGLQLTVDGYVNSVTDKIVAFPSTYVWRMVNFGRAHIAGVDATLAATAQLTERTGLQLNLSYTWQRAVDRTDATRESYDRQLPYMPRNIGSGMLLVKTPWADLGYRVNACGERYSMIQNTREYRLKPYWEHHLTAARTFELGKTRLTLLASLLNLSDTQYDIIQYYPMPGRSWQLTATIDL